MLKIFKLTTILLAFSAVALFANAEENTLPNTGLPIVKINTANGHRPYDKVTWIECPEITIIDTDGAETALTGFVKGRGNSTWNFDKKPYSIKLDSKSKILGMKSNKRWCLLANYIDRTLMRNDIAFEIGRRSGLTWTPTGRFVELVMNGDHLGNYYLCENIRAGSNRVDITEADPECTEGDGLTGGYIFEMDTNFDEATKFHSYYYKLPYMLHTPEIISDNQLSWVKNFIAKLEKSFKHINDPGEYEKICSQIDINSFIDWWFVYELTSNDEPQHPKSVYMHKDINGPLKMGPIWDFDWGTFDSWYFNSLVANKAIYYNELFSNPKFVESVKERWEEYKEQFESIPSYINQVANLIQDSEAINHEMWNIDDIHINYDETLTFSQAVTRIKSNYAKHYIFIDKTIKAMSGTESIAADSKIMDDNNYLFDLSGRELNRDASLLPGIYINAKNHKKICITAK